MNLTTEQIQHMVTTMDVGQRKTWIQEQGYQAWKANNYRGTMEMATGTGKTRIGVRAVFEALEKNPEALVYIVVPTETLRDVDWPNEMALAGYPGLEKRVRIVCWVALSKEKPNRDVDLVVLDEVHRITTQNSVFFNRDTYKVWNVLGLTATLPGEKWQNDQDKNMLISFLCPSCFEVPLEQAIELKIVTDFEMFVLMFDLDDQEYTVDGGTMKKPFKTTEKAHYQKLTKMMQRATWMKNEGMKFMAIQKRTEFLYNLKTKEKLARDVIEQVMKKNERTILFCGSIEQANNLCGANVYHSKTGNDALKAFAAEEINFLGVVQALNEGKNVPNIDQALIIQLTSKELNLIQRIGRAIRWRENHIPKIILLIAKGTADEKWYREATLNFEKSRIKEFYVKPQGNRSSPTTGTTGMA